MTQRLFISTNRLAKEWNLGALRTGVQPARWRAWRLGVAVDDVIGHVVSRCPREERRPIVGRQALPFLRHAVSVKASSHRHTRQDTDRTVLSCLVWRCELSRPTARQVRSASECVGRRRHCRCDRRTHSDALGGGVNWALHCTTCTAHTLRIDTLFKCCRFTRVTLC